MRLVNSAQSEGAPGASKRARAAHCLMAKMPYVALIAQGTPNQNLSKNDRQWQCGSRFAFWGDLDRQRRRRVRFVRGSWA
jgi:hypothetical protein